MEPKLSAQPALHFSLSTLLAVLSLTAFFCAALRFATEYWVMAANSLTLGILAISLLWQINTPSADRKFWMGFQIAGWTYFTIVFAPLFGRNISTALLSSKSLGHIQAYMPFTSPDNVSIEWRGTWFPGSILERRDFQYKIHYSGYGPEWDEWIGADRLRASGFDRFQQTGNAFYTLLVAACGGMLATLINRDSRRPKSRMKLLFGGVVCVLAVAGVFFLVLVNPSEIGASCLLTLTIALLIGATIGIVVSDPPRSAFLTGFTLFGWLYFFLHFSQLGSDPPNLLTSRLIIAAQEWLNPSPAGPMVAIAPGPMVATAAWSPSVYTQSVDPSANLFQIIAHSQLLLVAGLVGGAIALIFAKRKPGSEKITTSAPS